MRGRFVICLLVVQSVVDKESPAGPLEEAEDEEDGEEGEGDVDVVAPVLGYFHLGSGRGVSGRWWYVQLVDWAPPIDFRVVL